MTTNNDSIKNPTLTTNRTIAQHEFTKLFYYRLKEHNDVANGLRKAALDKAKLSHTYQNNISKKRTLNTDSPYFSLQTKSELKKDKHYRKDALKHHKITRPFTQDDVDTIYHTMFDLIEELLDANTVICTPLGKLNISVRPPTRMNSKITNTSTHFMKRIRALKKPFPDIYDQFLNSFTLPKVSIHFKPSRGSSDRISLKIFSSSSFVAYINSYLESKHPHLFNSHVYFSPDNQRKGFFKDLHVKFRHLLDSIL